MDLVADLGWLGYEGCLLEYSVVFDLDLVLLDEDGVVFVGDGVKDSPLCLFEGVGEWLH